MIGSSENELDREELIERTDEVPKRRSNPKRTGKRSADPLAASSSNPPAKRARKRVAVALRVVPKKSESLMGMTKRKYESLRWDLNQYELQKETKCGPMFRTVIQQKIYEEVILALETKIAPQRAIDFEHIKENSYKFGNIFETCDRARLGRSVIAIVLDLSRTTRCSKQ